MPHIPGTPRQDKSGLLVTVEKAKLDLFRMGRKKSEIHAAGNRDCPQDLCPSRSDLHRASNRS
jgi:hypothetical protein